MAMLCPVCKKQYKQRLQCPHCFVRLHYEEIDRSKEGLIPLHWTRTPWGRIALSVALSLGLYYVLHQLLLAGLLAVGSETTDLWIKLYGVLAAQILQTVTLFSGSLFAGAGERRGVIYGAIVGIWNGVLLVLFRSLGGEAISSVGLLGQPILHCACGAAGGLVGSWIWKPPAAVLRFSGLEPMPIVRRPIAFEFAAARVQWLRVFTGVAVAVGGVVCAQTILDLALEASEGRMTIRTSLQEYVLTLEISALAVFLGAAFAGAGTWKGSLQGTMVGLMSCAFLAGSRMFAGNVASSLPIELVLAGVLGLSFLGGSFGGRLLPPLIPDRTAGQFKPVPI